jgi:zinc transport system permease protein
MDIFFSILAEPFFHRVMLAGLAVALVAGPVGCFVVWRRMAYFGETLAHAGLLGAGLGLLFNASITLGAITVSMILALLLLALKSKRNLPLDTLLGILSHSALALGIIVIGLVTGAVTGHLDILFGDVLTVSTTDVWIIWAVAVASLLLLAFLWRNLIAIAVHEDLAAAEGVNVARTELLFMLLIAFVIAMSMKVVGLLLITALTVIPAAAARRLATSPEQMAVFSIIISALAVISGLFLSAAFGIIAGPSIVLSSSLIFMFTLPLQQRS